MRTGSEIGINKLRVKQTDILLVGDPNTLIQPKEDSEILKATKLKKLCSNIAQLLNLHE